MAKARILIVEDEPILARDLQIRLQNLDYEVVACVHTGSGAIEATLLYNPDLVLMDIMIEGEMDGIKTAQNLRDLTDMPIVYLTSCADDETFERATKAAPQAYLVKPVQERELDLCIRTSIQKYSLEKRLLDSEVRYRSLFENTKEAIIIFDNEGRVLETNKATHEIYANVIKQSKFEFLHEYFYNETQENFRIQLSRFLQEGEAQGRFWLRSTDGLVQKCIEYNAKARFLPNTHLAVLRDVSESAIARREIENLAKFPSEAPDPVLRVSFDGKIMYANKASSLLLNEWKTRYGEFLPDNLLGKISELSVNDPQTQLMIVVTGKIYSLLFVYVEKGHYVNIYANDITQQKYTERIVNYQKDILELIARNAPLLHILEQICTRIQYFLTGCTASVFNYNGFTNTLKLGASPRLSNEMVQLIEQLNVLENQDQDPCVLAINSQQDVLISNLPYDPLGVFYKNIAQKYNYMGLWVKPVMSQDGDVVACLVLFFRDTFAPNVLESNLISMAANLISVASERDFIFQSLHKQALAFENINDAIFLADGNGLITEWSPSAEKLFGYRKADMVGKLLSAHDLFTFTEGFSHFLAKPSDKRWSGELEFTTQSGDKGTIELSTIRLNNIEDSYLDILCVARDITQKRNVETALRVSETNLKAIFDNTVQSFILLDKQFKVIAFNRTAKQISYAVTGKFLQIGDAITDYWYTDESTMLLNIMERTLNGEYISYEEYITTRLGESYWLEINFLPIYDSSKNITSICFTTLDIQDRKNTELALAASEARFRSLVQNSSDVIIVLETDGKISYVSESVARLLGYKENELLDQNILEYIHPDDKGYLSVLLQNLSDGLMSIPPIEYRIKHLRGHYIFVESVCTNLLDEPAVKGIVFNSRNIEERKTSEETLKNIVKGVSDATGKDFFKSLVENLATYLNVSHVVISEVADPEHLHTLAYFKNGRNEDNFHYRLAGTPCEYTMQQQIYYVEENIAFVFPDDTWLLEEGIETYLGVRLNDSKGNAMGLLCVMDKKPLDNNDLAGSMLRIFSVRAAAELERIYTTEALVESKANLLSLIENTIDNIWAIDRQYNVIALNSSFQKDFVRAFGHELVIGDNITAYLPEPMKSEWLSYYNRALDGEQFFKELEFAIEGIVQQYTEVYFNPICDEDGQVSGISIFARDTTQRKRAENALRESEVNLVALIENTDDIIYSISSEYEILAANSAFRRLHNLMFSRIIKPGMNIINSLPPQYAEVWKEGFEKAKKGERVRKEIHYEHVKFPVDLEVSFNPIYTKGGAISGISIFARDITLRKQGENELKRTNFELDSFVYRASHDLRAPLRSVLGLINLLRIEQNADQRSIYLGLMEKSINKLDTFISDLTHFSRNSRLSLNIEKVDFNAIIQDCLDNLRYMENAEKIASRLSIEQNIDFYSDASRITIILQNLVSNAIKYQRRGEGAYVAIDITTSEFASTIIVEDNGRGIDEVYLERIFDMFFRASEDSYGSGLGLYITKQVVEKLEGNIKVESEIGVGTTFIIKIPNMQSQAKLV